MKRSIVLCCVVFTLMAWWVYADGPSGIPPKHNTPGYIYHRGTATVRIDTRTLRGDKAHHLPSIPMGRPLVQRVAPRGYRVFLSARQANGNGQTSPAVILSWRPERDGVFRIFARCLDPYGTNAPPFVLVDVDYIAVMDQLPVIRR